MELYIGYILLLLNSGFASSIDSFNKTTAFVLVSEIKNLGHRQATYPTTHIDNLLGLGGIVWYKINGTSYNGSFCTNRTSVDYFITISEAFENDYYHSQLHSLDIDWESRKVTKSSSSCNISVTLKEKGSLKNGQIVGQLFKGEGILAQNQDGTLWVFSENSTPYQKVTNFIQKLLSPKMQNWDINSFDRRKRASDRLVKLSPLTGEIMEDFNLPDYFHWDGNYHWNVARCGGTRNLQGLHAGGMTPDRQYSALMTQTSLYQDGGVSTHVTPARIRILVYRLVRNELVMTKQFRYDTGLKRISSLVRGEQHFIGVFAMIPISTQEFIVAEQEVNSSIKKKQNILKIYYARADESRNEITKDCIVKGLMHLNCSEMIEPMNKWLIYEEETKGAEMLEALAWDGQSTKNGGQIKTVTAVYEDDGVKGPKFHRFRIDIDQLRQLKDNQQEIKKNNANIDRIALNRLLFIIIPFCGVFQLLYVLLFYIIPRYMKTEITESDNANTSHVRTSTDGNNITTTTPPTVTRVFQRPMTKAHYSFFSGVLCSTFIGGIVFGVSGFTLILRKEGIGAAECACATFCIKQAEWLVVFGLLSLSVTIGSRILFGLFMDRHGPRRTCMLAGCLSISGALILSLLDTTCSNVAENNEDIRMLNEDKCKKDMITAAMLLLAAGGSGVHITSFHMSNLFAKHEKSKASALISTGFGAGSLTWPLLQILHQRYDWRISNIGVGLVILFIILICNNVFVQPNRPYKPNTKVEDIEIRGISHWIKTLTESTIGRNKLDESNTSLPPVRDEMRLIDILKSPRTWCEFWWFTGNLFTLTFYLSGGLVNIMYAKGDAVLSDGIKFNNWVDYMYSRAGGWINGLGFLWFPLVSMALKRYTPQRWSRMFLLTSILNIIFLLSLQLVLEAQVVSFMLQSLVRLLIFTSHFTYIPHRFGFKYFGILNGISSLVAAVVGLVLVYPLLVLGIWHGFDNPIWILIVIVATTIIFPIVEMRAELNESNLQLNWAETYSIDKEKMVYPKNEEELRKLLSTHSCVKVVGAMHSCAPLVHSDDIVVSMDNFQIIHEINTEEMYVRCDAGVKMYSLSDELGKNGLAVPTMGTVDWQTIGGAIMTGTHGGGLTCKSLHVYVRAYRVMFPNGRVRWVRASWSRGKSHNPLFDEISMKDPDHVDEDFLFLALAPSMGTLGVILELELQCVPLQYLEAKIDVLPYDETFIRKFKSIAEANKFFRCVVYPHIQVVSVWTANPIRGGISEYRNIIRQQNATEIFNYMNFRTRWEKTLLEVWLWIEQRFKYGALCEWILRKVVRSQCERMRHYVGQWHHVLCKERNHGIPHADMELGFDYHTHAENILEELRAKFTPTQIPYYNYEIRCTGRDDALISVAHARDVIWVDFQAKANVAKEYFQRMCALTERYGYRKHWAKGMETENVAMVTEQFKYLGDFLTLAKYLDPEMKLQNQHNQLWFTKYSSGCVGVKSEEAIKTFLDQFLKGVANE